VCAVTSDTTLELLELKISMSSAYVLFIGKLEECTCKAAVLLISDAAMTFTASHVSAHLRVRDSMHCFRPSKSSLIRLLETASTAGSLGSDGGEDGELVPLLRGTASGAGVAADFAVFEVAALVLFRDPMADVSWDKPVDLVALLGVVG
jgi:hypothetical protein